MRTLKFTRTISRGQNTYGCSICSLWIDGKKVASCNGGEYDDDNRIDDMNQEFMEGRVLAAWMEKELQLSLNGACGFSSMERILKEIGYTLHYVDEGRNYTTYILEGKEAPCENQT